MLLMYLFVEQIDSRIVLSYVTRPFSNVFIVYPQLFFIFYDVVSVFLCLFVLLILLFIYLFMMFFFILSRILALYIVQSVIQPLGCNGFLIKLSIYHGFCINSN